MPDVIPASTPRLFMVPDILLLLVMVFLLLFLIIFRLPTSGTEREYDRQAQIVHKKTWGRPWPRRPNTVKQAEIGQMGDGDELYVDGGITDHFDYLCLDGIGEVAQALSVPLNLEDILVIREEYEYILAKLNLHSFETVCNNRPSRNRKNYLPYISPSPSSRAPIADGPSERI
ncbi:hypothetical protein C8R44DRAFT_420114 [Mycena epipterygia]|nr:hypothetical protein C8R44DRAFT_420114 [Mycena epipterygia]